MTTHSTTNYTALVCGLIATAGALAILLQDALRTGIWTIEHGLIPCLIVVQILTGHLFVTALHKRRWLPALGFLIVAFVSTYGVLATSVEKQSAIQAEATAKAEDVNGRRQSIERSIADAEAMLSPCPDGTPKMHFGNRCSLREAMTAECATGKGNACTGKTASVTLYEAALKTHRTELGHIGPAHKVGAKSENMATLISALTGRDKGKTQQVLEIIRPFTFALIFELAALVSFGFAFGHRAAATISGKPATQADLHAEIDPATVAILTAETPENEPPKPRGTRKTNRQSNVVQFPAKHPVIEALDKAGGTVSSNRDLARIMGVTDGEASKRVREVAHLLTIERIGKETRISRKSVA